MKKILTQIVAGIIVLIFGTALGTIVEKYRTESQNKIRYLDVSTEKYKRLFSTPNIPNKELKIILDGKPIHNLSQISVLLYNFSDQDFTEVPVYIELRPEAGGSLEVVSENVVGENELPEAISQIKSITPSKYSGATRYGYVIKNANRGDATSSTIFKASYLLLGVKSPDVVVLTDKKGLKLRPFSFSHTDKNSLKRILLSIFAPIFILTCYVLLFVVTIKLGKKNQAKRDSKLQEKIGDVLQENSISKKFGINPDISSDLSKFLINYIKEYRWEKTPKLLRFLSVNAPPPKDKHGNE